MANQTETNTTEQPESKPIWRGKASRIIAELSHAAWLQANTKRDGSRYKRHRPYTIPKVAEDLVACLGMHDQRAAEHRAKQIFCWELQTAGDPDQN